MKNKNDYKENKKFFAEIIRVLKKHKPEVLKKLEITHNDVTKTLESQLLDVNENNCPKYSINSIETQLFIVWSVNNKKLDIESFKFLFKSKEKSFNYWYKIIMAVLACFNYYFWYIDFSIKNLNLFICFK